MKKNKLHLAAVALLIFNLQFLTFNSSAQITKLLDFAGTSNGSNPYGDLLVDGSFMYGMTESGGANDLGTIFKIKPDGTGYSKLLDFAGATNGSHPNGTLYSDGTFLYGMTDSGGTNNMGVIFKIKLDGTGYSKLLDFAGSSNGRDARGSLISDGTFLYGTTAGGGSSDYGTIFKIKPDGSNYTLLRSFSGNPDGNDPNDLIFDGTFLYGTTQLGGTSDLGTIFKIKPDGTSYSKLLDFNSTNGDNPGSLILEGTFLYGMTWFGGVNDMGVLFKIKPDGTSYANILDFSTTKGNYPSGKLISDGTFLYGMTWMGGTNDMGTIFKVKSDGTGFAKLLDFSGTNGESPIGSLISDGTYLYGMTEIGGTNSIGTIFKFQFCTTGCGTDIAENIVEFGVDVYPNPTNGLLNVRLNSIENAQIKIYNVLGECVYQNIGTSSMIQIDLSAQSDGVYFVSIKTNEGEVNTKLIVRH